MANFLYNGVELPDINTVWTDKETYPYAYLFDVRGDTLNSLLNNYGFPSLVGTVDVAYFVHFSNKPYVWDGRRFCNSESDGAAIAYSYLHTVFTDWTFAESWSHSSSNLSYGKPASTDYTYLWCSADLVNTDNTVYLAASTPIRVDSKLKISVPNTVGEDVLLTANISVSYNSSVGAYVSEPLDGLDDISVGDTVHVLTAEASYIDIVSTITNFGGITGFGSVDLTFTDRPYLFAKADIGAGEHWYMVTTSSGDHLMSVRKPVPIVEKPYLYNGIKLPKLPEWDKEAYPYAFIMYDEFSWGIVCGFRAYDKPFTQIGNYLYYKDGTSHGVSWTYSSVGFKWEFNGEVDFDASNSTSANWSNYDILYEDGSVYLAASDPVPSEFYITSTTAGITFACTNLENTEPIDCIKAWVYKKSDGLNTTIPPTWTSEMFSAPAYSTTHTFTGLTPNTEYEVYGCIFVNGEATDHNAIAVFTTFESSGDLKPVYKRESGKWVKKTAYERQNGEWVLISTAAM